MPRKALRCSVELNIHAISCPGVYLPRRDDVYLSVCMFGQIRRTQLSNPTFPLLFHERFRFDKVFYTAHDPSHVAERLEDEHVVIELIQLSEVYDHGHLLAQYRSTTKDFLYPYPSYTSFYGTADRDVLMDRSIEFPGISPKMEFSTKTAIKETTAPTNRDMYDDLQVLKSYDDDLHICRRSRSPNRMRSRSRASETEGKNKTVEFEDQGSKLPCSRILDAKLKEFEDSRKKWTEESRVPTPKWVPAENRNSKTKKKKKVARKSSVKRYRRPTVASVYRSRSISPTRNISHVFEDLTLDDEIYGAEEERPPFVVRHVDNKLIGRSPKGLNSRKGHVQRRSRSRSPAGRRRVTSPCCRPSTAYGYSSDTEPTYVYKSLTEPEYRNGYYTDTYNDVGNYSTRRARPVSPVLFRPSLGERFDDISYSRAKQIHDRVDNALHRSRSPSSWRMKSYPSMPSLANGRLYDSDLSDYDMDMSVARNRRYYNY